MKIFPVDISAILAIQHRVLKDLRKKNGLRQRDWEVLCACHRLSYANYPFTASKLSAYLQGAYFLPSLYDSIQVLVKKTLIRVVVSGKPFKPESYELTYEGRRMVRELTDGMRRLSLQQDATFTGAESTRLW